jgi:hypothetical protein
MQPMQIAINNCGEKPTDSPSSPSCDEALGRLYHNVAHTPTICRHDYPALLVLDDYPALLVLDKRCAVIFSHPARGNVFTRVPMRLLIIVGLISCSRLSATASDDPNNSANQLDERFHETTQLQIWLSAARLWQFRAFHMIRILEALV